MENVLFLQIYGKTLYYILFGVFIFSFIIQLFYYLIIYIRIIFYKDKPNSIKQEAVSVVICARNEADNLIKFLPLILNQNYPDYEVIVVNDSSTDNTENVLLRFKNEYSMFVVRYKLNRSV